MYPAKIWELEIATIIFYFFLQMFRLNMGYAANRTENKIVTLLFLLITLFSTLFGVYFSFQTTYVLLIEIIVGIIGIFFGLLEIGISFAAFIIFTRAGKM